MNIDLKFYWSLFLRRLPLMAALFLLCAGVGVALAIKLPTTYSTSARLLVESPEIQELSINANRGEQLEIITQRLLTRANLIEIAHNRQVFDNINAMAPDDIVKAMREATDIRRRGGRNRATLITVSFEAGDPRTVATVVNDYVTLILEENVRLRTGQAESTLAFFNQEVERLDTELQLQSQRILAFKSENSNALPENLDYRMNRESLLQERVSRAERELDNLRKQRQRVIEVYESTGRLPGAERSPAQRRLDQLEKEKESLLLVYSETSPKVRVVQTQIDQVKSQIEAESGPRDTEQESILNIALAQIDGQINATEETLQRNLAELKTLRVSIEETAANGIMLDSLERDYANVRNQYTAAVSRRNQAQLSEQIELTSRGQRISVLQQATIPNSPSSPNRPVVAAGGVGVGLAAMAALFLLLELLNRTIRRPVELTSGLGVFPLATIPYMETRRHFWIRRTAKLTLLLAVIIAVPAGLWALDTYYLPLDLIYDRVLTRIGL